MNIRRSVTVAALATLAALTFTAPASAQIYRIDRPSAGTVGRGLADANSAYTGTDKLEFGGAYNLGSYTGAIDNDKLCAASNPSTMCANNPSWMGSMRKDCEREAREIQARNCARRGKDIYASAAASMGVTVFGTDVSLYDVHGNASSTSAIGAASFGLTLMGYSVVAEAASSALSGRYVVPDYGIDLVSHDLLSLQGYLIRISVGAQGQLWVDRQISAVPGATSARASIAPGGALWGNISAGAGAGSYTVGVQGSMEILSLGVQLDARAQLAQNGTFTSDLSRGVTLGMASGNVRLGIFGWGIPSNMQIPIVNWYGSRFYLPTQRAAYTDVL